MSATKELRIQITGNADQFGAAANKAKQYVNELKAQGLDLLTAGVYAGGAAALALRLPLKRCAAHYPHCLVLAACCRRTVSAMAVSWI
jgi:hypothetical protein